MSEDVVSVVDSSAGVDNLKIAIAERIKKFRGRLGVTQKELCGEIGMPLPSLRNYEAAKQIPGGEAILGFMHAGINANWLLTGESPMLLADLVTPTAVKLAQPEISFVALAQALSAMQATTRAGESPMDTARKAVEFYQFMDEKGLVTPEGFSQGEMDSAA